MRGISRRDERGNGRAKGTGEREKHCACVPCRRRRFSLSEKGRACSPSPVQSITSPNTTHVNASGLLPPFVPPRSTFQTTRLLSCYCTRPRRKSLVALNPRNGPSLPHPTPLYTLSLSSNSPSSFPSHTRLIPLLLALRYPVS